MPRFSDVSHFQDIAPPYSPGSEHAGGSGPVANPAKPFAGGLLGHAPTELPVHGDTDHFPPPQSADVDILSRVEGVRLRHPQTFDRYWLGNQLPTSGLSAGAQVVLVPAQGATTVELGFRAQTLLIDNPGSPTLLIPRLGRFIPPGVYGFAVPCYPPIDILEVVLFAGVPGSPAVISILATERKHPDATGAAAGPSAAAPGPVSLRAAGTADAVPGSAIDEVGIAGFNGATWERLRTANNLASSGYNGVGIPVSLSQLFNGNTLDYYTNNIQGTLLASAARTGTTSSPNQTNFNARGVIVFWNISGAGTSTVQLNLDYAGPDGSFYTSLQSALLTTTGTRAYIVYPGVGAASVGVTGTASFPLARTWRVNIVHGDASSWTYQITHSYVL